MNPHQTYRDDKDCSGSIVETRVCKWEKETCNDMKRAQLTPQLELAHEIQPKIQEGATHDKKEHVLAFDDGNASLIERIQRQDNNCQDHESRWQRPRHHIYGEFIHKGWLHCCCFCFFFLHSHPEHLT